MTLSTEKLRWLLSDEIGGINSWVCSDRIRYSARALIEEVLELRDVTKVSKYMAEAESLERKCNQLAEENKKLRYSTAADYLRKWSDEDYDELSSENDKLCAENARLREALGFYAKQEHFAGLETFDTISGEPQNYLAPDGEGCELCQQAVIEDGHVARAALEQSTKGDE